MDECKCDNCGETFGDHELNLFRDEMLCCDCLHIAEDAASEEKDQIAMIRWGGL